MRDEVVHCNFYRFLQDLVEAGITVEPFFISTGVKPFDVNKFYSVSRLPRILFSTLDNIHSLSS